jgi:hypothetical protein
MTTEFGCLPRIVLASNLTLNLPFSSLITLPLPSDFGVLPLRISLKRYFSGDPFHRALHYRPGVVVLWCPRGAYVRTNLLEYPKSDQINLDCTHFEN